MLKKAFLEHGPADGLFLSGGSFRTRDLIEPLEQDLGVPVVTSNQAGLWNVLRLAGVREPIQGYGKLLEMV